MLTVGLVGTGGVLHLDDVAVHAWSCVSLGSWERGDSVSGGWGVVQRGGEVHTCRGVHNGNAAVGAARVGQVASLPVPRVWGLGGVSWVSSGGGVVVLTMDLGDGRCLVPLVVWRWAAVRVGQGPPYMSG